MSFITEPSTSESPAFESGNQFVETSPEPTADAITEEGNAAEAVKKEEPEIKEVSEAEKQFNSKFAALSRREKQMRQMEAQLDSKMRALDERMAKLDQFSAPKEPEKAPELPLEYRLKQNPLEVLKSLGLGYEKLTELALNDGKLTPDMQMDLMRQELDAKYAKELESIKSQLAERDKKAEEQKYADVVNNFKNSISDMVNKNDDYELIRANNAVEVVYDLIESHYNETGNILDTKEAADLVESQLVEEAERLFKLNKLKSKLGVQAPAAAKSPAAKSPTLQNNQAIGASLEPKKFKSREESAAYAASLLKWNN